MNIRNTLITFLTHCVLRVKVGLNESAKNSLSQLLKTARFDGFMKSLIGFNILSWGTKIPRRHITFNYSLSHPISSMSNTSKFHPSLDISDSLIWLKTDNNWPYSTVLCIFQVITLAVTKVVAGWWCDIKTIICQVTEIKCNLTMSLVESANRVRLIHGYIFTSIGK